MPLILLVKPNCNREHEFVAELLKAEGLFHFKLIAADELTETLLRQSLVVVTLRGDLDDRATRLVIDYVCAGGGLLSLMPGGTLANRLGVKPWIIGSTQKTQKEKQLAEEQANCASNLQLIEHAKVAIRPSSELPVPPEPLYCPLQSSFSMTCPGERVADLLDETGKQRGLAIVRKRIGRGTAYVTGYDPVGSVLRLRHGTWRLDQNAAMLPLRGPRHIFGLIGIAERHSRQYPLADIHQDLLRHMLLDLHPPMPAPRLWHLPNAQRIAVFFKSDGCGEEGTPVGLELAERYGHCHNFFRAPVSRYNGAQIRQWAQRGHFMSIELDLFAITYNKRLAELGTDVHDRIGDMVDTQAKRFVAETDLNLSDIVIHGCQWTGASTAAILIERGWRMPFHFCGHDPRMSRHDYGPFSLPSGMPLRYFDPGQGVLDLFLQPCTIDDSQSITEPSVGTLNISQVEFAESVIRWVTESRDYWHVPHIGTFHPCYLIRDKGDPRRTFEAANMVYAALTAMGIEAGSLEAWSQFVQARDTVRLELIECSESHSVAALTAARDLRGLTIIAEMHGPAHEVQLDGQSLPIVDMEIEGHHRSAVVVSLAKNRRVELVIKG